MGNLDIIEQDFIPAEAPKVYIVANSAQQALEAQEKIERKGGIRLTQAMRDSVIAKAVDSKFKKSGEVLDKQEAKLAHKAMVAAFGRANLEALAKVGAPYAYVNCDDHGDPLTGEALENYKGRRVTWRVGALGYQHTMRVLDPLPLNVGYSSTNTKYFVVKAGPLADEIIAWQEACQEWLREKRALTNKVHGLLYNVTTFNSLQKTWPEGKKFWEHIPVDFPFRNQVPATMVSDINEELGL